MNSFLEKLDSLDTAGSVISWGVRVSKIAAAAPGLL